MRIPLALLVASLLLTACRTTSGPDFTGAGEMFGGNDQLQVPGQYAGSGGVPGGTGVTDPQPQLTSAQRRAIQERRLAQARSLWQRAECSQSPAQKAGIYETLADDYPEFPNAAEARYRQGRNEYLIRQYMDSVTTLEEYMQIAPVNPHLADIEEMIYDSGVRYIRNKGGWLANIFKTDEDGLNALRYVAAAFPAGEYADDALMFMGNYYRDDEEPDTAALMYRELLQKYPDSEWSFEARKGLARTYAMRDQGSPYNAGFVDQDPREDVPDDPRARAHAGPVKSSLKLAIEQYDRFIERIDRDPGRCGEYTLQVDQVKALRQQAREKLACKDDRVAAWYASRGNQNAALVYRRSAARLRGDTSISCLPLDLCDPSAVPDVAPAGGMPLPPSARGRSGTPPATVSQDSRRTGSRTFEPDLSRSSVPPPAYDLPPSRDTTRPGVPQDFSGSSTLPPVPPPPRWPSGR